MTTLADRRFFAKEAFGVSSAYDNAIFNYFDAESASDFRVAILKHNNACGIALCSRRPSSLIGRCRVLFFPFFIFSFYFLHERRSPRQLKRQSGALRPRQDTRQPPTSS